MLVYEGKMLHLTFFYQCIWVRMHHMAFSTSVYGGKDASYGIFYQCVWGEGCIIWHFLLVYGGKNAWSGIFYQCTEGRMHHMAFSTSMCWGRMLDLAFLAVCGGKDALYGILTIFYKCVLGEECLIWHFLPVCVRGRMLPLAFSTSVCGGKDAWSGFF